MITNPREQNDHFGADGSRNAENPLESAAAYITGSARPTGEEPFELRREIANAQRGSLVQWAQSQGLIVSPSIWVGKTSIGGSEHDIWDQNQEYWKVTRPDHFGWTVLPGENGFPEMAEATPLEYLERWIYANRYLGDQAKLRGVAITEQGVQVVVSHPIIKGPNPGKLLIAEDMMKRGFVLVPRFVVGAEIDSSFYNDVERVGIFDAAHDNFIRSQGVPVAIDVITLRPGDVLRRQLLELIKNG